MLNDAGFGLDRAGVVASAPRSADGDDGEPDRRPRHPTAPLPPTSAQVSISMTARGV